MRLLKYKNKNTNVVIEINPDERTTIELHKRIQNESEWEFIEEEIVGVKQTIVNKKVEVPKQEEKKTENSSQQMFEEHCNRYFDNYKKIRMKKTSSLKKIGVIIDGYNNT